MIADWFRRAIGIPPSSRRRSADERHEARKAVRFPVKVHVDGQSVTCQTINLSASGALLNTALKTSVGSIVQIEVSHLPRLVAARVARVGAHSTAIRFQSIEMGSSLVGSVLAEIARGASRSVSAPLGRRAVGATHARR